MFFVFKRDGLTEYGIFVKFVVFYIKLFYDLFKIGQEVMQWSLDQSRG